MDYALYGKRYDKKKCRLHTNICDNKLNGLFDIGPLEKNQAFIYSTKQKRRE